MSEVADDLMEVSRDVVKRLLRRYSINDASINSIGFTEYEFARALAAERERATLAERERISKALDDEADVIPCAEDAMVTRGNALLVRADFSYEEADRIEESSASP